MVGASLFAGGSDNTPQQLGLWQRLVTKNDQFSNERPNTRRNGSQRGPSFGGTSISAVQNIQVEGREIAPEVTEHGLPLSKCEAYKRVYDQPYGSS
jgi:hypothetical protein